MVGTTVDVHNDGILLFRVKVTRTDRSGVIALPISDLLDDNVRLEWRLFGDGRQFTDEFTVSGMDGDPRHLLECRRGEGVTRVVVREDSGVLTRVARQRLRLPEFLTGCR